MLGAADYPRPCIIVDIAPDGTLAILPISTKKYANAATFLVDESQPDFKATGLTATSYIFDGPVRDTPPSQIIKIMGELTGTLEQIYRLDR